LELGWLDLSTGALSGSSVSFVSGTGTLEGATGTLSFEGLAVGEFGSPAFAHDLKGENLRRLVQGELTPVSRHGREEVSDNGATVLPSGFDMSRIA